MTGRTLRFMGLMIVGSWMMFEGVTITAVVAIIITYVLGEPLWIGIRNRYVEFWKRRMFRICFVDHPPPNEKEISKYGLHQIPFGYSEHFLRVVCAEGLRLERFNVRFIDPSEIAFSEERIDLQSIVRIAEVHLMPEVHMQGIASTMIDDEKGGIDVVLDRPLVLAVREPFTVKICVSSGSQPWIGKVSFRGIDNEHNRRTHRKEVQIASEAPMPDIYKTRVPAATSTLAGNFRIR